MKRFKKVRGQPHEADYTANRRFEICFFLSKTYAEK